jgi:hypothetical protein
MGDAPAVAGIPLHLRFPAAEFESESTLTERAPTGSPCRTPPATGSVGSD